MIKLEHSNVKESSKQPNKFSKFVENTKMAINKAIATTGIAVSTLYPASINTISTTAPLLSSPIAKTITVGTATSLLAACSENTVPEEIKDTTPPTIDILKPEIDVTGGKEMQIIGNQLYIGGTIVASRSDNISKECKVQITINGGGFKSGDTIVDEGTLTIRVSDQCGNVKTAEIKLKLTKEEQSPISGLETLKNASLQVDKEINLLKGITFAYGIKLIKTEIVIDGQKNIIEDPNHYTPEYPGECSIIFTIEKKDNTTEEITVDKLTIKPLDYKALSITSLKPADILPIIGQIEWGDGYSPIEHLRVAESTKMRDMMRKYGAGNHTSEQYQQLMSRLHTGMTGENPIGYNNYEKLGGDFIYNPSNHAHNERNILNTIINHANYEIAGDNERDKTLNQLAKNNPNNIHIFGNSIYVRVNTNETLKNEWENLKEASKLPNFIFFIAGSNIDTKNGIIKNKIFHEDIDPDPSCIYGLPSFANGQNDTKADKHLILTIGTNSKGNSDISNKSIGSNFPVGFHPNILFSGRAFPYTELQYGHIRTQVGHYETSLPNYFNVAMTDLCFQMFAEVENVDQLLDMIRTTSLTDYISLDGETQALHLINPAGFIKKYLMPTDLPAEIKSGEILPLNKGYYKGIIFDIPGTEVNINGEWIAYNDTNKNLIKNQNPFILEWRLNGNLCKKLGYSSSKPIQGKIIITDDKFNGLNITKDISLTYAK